MSWALVNAVKELSSFLEKTQAEIAGLRTKVGDL